MTTTTTQPAKTDVQSLVQRAFSGAPEDIMLFDLVFMNERFKDESAKTRGFFRNEAERNRRAFQSGTEKVRSAFRDEAANLRTFVRTEVEKVAAAVRRETQRQRDKIGKRVALTGLFVGLFTAGLFFFWGFGGFDGFVEFFGMK